MHQVKSFADEANNVTGKDLEEYSLDTVKMFHGDATAAGFRL